MKVRGQPRHFAKLYLKKRRGVMCKGSGFNAQYWKKGKGKERERQTSTKKKLQKNKKVTTSFLIIMPGKGFTKGIILILEKTENIRAGDSQS